MEPKISELSRAKWVPVSLIIIISMVTSTVDSARHHHHHHLNSTHYHVNGDAAFSNSSINLFQGQRSGFIIKLIHRDSVESPLYNQTSSLSSYDRVIRDINHDQARAIQLLYGPNSLARTSLELDFPGLYFITFYIHDISHPQYTILDTGSHLIWVMCSPCSNCPHTTLYHILNSSILTPLICSSNTICPYKRRYIKGLGSDGFRASDTFLFIDDAARDDEGEYWAIKDVEFGCGTKLFNTETLGPESRMMGVFGIGPLSSLVQKVECFSYCLESRYVNTHDISSHLAIGDAAILKGPSTPLLYYLNHYTAQLVGFTVGESGSEFFKAEKIIIDCGASLTYLQPRIFYKFKDLVDSIARYILPVYWGDIQKISSLKFRYCYEGDFNTMLEEFPQVKFHFASDVQITAGPQQLFMEIVGNHKTPNLVCLKIFPTTNSQEMESGVGDASLLGVDLQTEHNIGFNVKNKLMYISNDNPCSESFHN